MFAVVMAGGGGTRLWPKSREHHPKQMHSLAGRLPLVQQNSERLQRILGEENVFVVTNSHHAARMRELMPSMRGRVIVDPYRRDTAPAIGLSAVYLSKIDPDGVMGVFPADPYITDDDRFADTVRAAGKLAERGHAVTLGIKPSGPDTGFGYIEQGELFEKSDGLEAYRVKRFVEKPGPAMAQEYYASGNYLWNSGIYVWSIPKLLDLFKEHLPDMHSRLMTIRDAIGTPGEAAVVSEEYEGMQRISIDYGITEKLTDILVVPSSFGWCDVGCWSTVYDIASKDCDENVVQGIHVGIDTKRCIVISSGAKVVGTIGLEDLVIVDTEDALLVCRADRTQDVRKLVEKLKTLNMSEYL